MKIVILLLALGLAQAQDCEPTDFAFNPLDPTDAFSQECIDAITADALAGGTSSFCVAECQGLYDAYFECFGQDLTETFFSACGGFQGTTGGGGDITPTEEPADCDPTDFAFNPLDPTDAFSQECIDAITADALAGGNSSFCVAECQGLYNAYLECFGETVTDTFFDACGGFEGNQNPDFGGDDGGAPTTTAYISLVALSAAIASVFAKL